MISLSEEEQSKQKPNKPSELSIPVEALSGLLDFYSDRATSFASLMIASIFGVVTLAAIIQTIGNNPIIKGLSLFPYIAFCYAGYYSWKRFISWAIRADKIERHCLRLPNSSYLKKVQFKREGSEELTNMNDFLIEESASSSSVLVKGTRKIITHKFGFEIGYLAVIVTLAIVAYLG